jgi:hypothetical protein
MLVKRLRRVLVLVMCAICALLTNAPVASANPPPPETFAFYRWWEHWDQPVLHGVATRTWLWGSGLGHIGSEPYNGGMRGVEYYDKGRMEINDAQADPNLQTPDENLWYVTSGLLATELITGNVQTGDATFEQRDPARIPVAGDPDSVSTPTYATFRPLLGAAQLPTGSIITQTLDAQGAVGADERFAGEGVVALDVGAPTGHSVASVFWDFMTSSGPVYYRLNPDTFQWEYVTKPLFANPFYATGYPLTEAYWTQAQVAGTVVDVLAQCFERRCLTYTPGNDAAWRVEFGNIGQHYYRWRYAEQ